MRLFFLVDNNEPHASGGGYNALFKFAEFLARRGHPTFVHAVHDLGWSAPVPGCRVRYRPWVPRRGRILRKVDKTLSRSYDRLVLEPALRRFAPDWILGVLTESAIKAHDLGRRHRVPVANFLYETPPWVREMVGPERFDREFVGYTKKLWEETRRAYLGSAVLFPNSALAGRYASQWLEGRAVAAPVYPGVDVEQMNGQGLRARTVSGRPKLLYVGRLAPAKNVDLLLRAWLLLTDRPEVHICGEGPERPRLEALVAGTPGVTFHGFLPDGELWRLYAACDLVVVPSSFEGFGMPPMQALFFEKPCLASDIPIFRTVYGDRLEYFPHGDVAALARKIRELLDDHQDRPERRLAGREFVIQNFTWERSAETIERELLLHSAARAAVPSQAVSAAEERPRSSSLLHSSAVYAVANLLQRGVSLLLLPLYARHFSRAEFGAMEQIYQGVLVITLLTSFGLPQALVRGFYLESRDEADRQRLLGALLVFLLPLTLVVSATMIVFRAGLTTALFSGEGRAEWLVWGVAFYVTMALQQLPLMLFRVRQEASRYVTWALVTFLIVAVANVYLIVVRGWGLVGMLAGNVLGFGVTAVLLLPALIQSSRWCFDFRRLRPLFAFGLPLLMALLGRKVLEVADRYMIPIYHGLDTLGGYVMAAKVANIVDALLLVPFLYAWQPFFYVHSADPAAGKIFARVTNAMFGLLCTMLVGLAAVRGPLLNVLGGGKYSDAAPLVLVLAAAVLFNGMQYCISPGIHIRKKLFQETGLMLCAAGLNMVLNLWLIPTYAALGAAVATAAAYLFYLVTTFALSQRHYPVFYHWSRMGLTALLAVTALAALEATSGLAVHVVIALLFAIAGPGRDLWVHGDLRSLSRRIA